MYIYIYTFPIKISFTLKSYQRPLSFRKSSSTAHCWFTELSSKSLPCFFERRSACARSCCGGLMAWDADFWCEETYKNRDIIGGFSTKKSDNPGFLRKFMKKRT